MDHDATREQLELAAVEPGGLERLMAGDTVAAQAVAAHVAGCPACAQELARLQRATPLIRASLRELPSPDLKARTLAAIRAEGVVRPIAAGMIPAVPATAAAPALPPPAAAPARVGTPVPIDRPRRLAPALGWVATIAAAIVLSVVTTSLIVGNRVDNELADQAETISALEEVTTTALAVNAQPDEQHVALAGVSDPTLAGSLTFSPSTTELVWLATGLTPPSAGLEYRCWVEVGGTRHRVGKMFFSQDLAYWAGETGAVSGLTSGATFGVSLVDATGDSVSTEPVLLGTL
jgi:hypothetical protein